MDDIPVRVIGRVDSPEVLQKDESWGAVEARVILKPEYRDGLHGLEQFSHAIIVTYLHEAGYDPSRHLVRRPRGLKTMPEMGIFAQRAKDRPNPVGITVVSIVGVEPGALVVRGLDAIDGTPVIDVKPYYPVYDRVDAPKVPAWVTKLMKGYF